jgi:hypothetical protein
MNIRRPTFSLCVWLMFFSMPVRNLVCLAYSTLRSAMHCSHESADHLCQSVHDMFSLYCDVLPTYHGERIRTLPLMAGRCISCLLFLFYIAKKARTCILFLMNMHDVNCAYDFHIGLYLMYSTSSWFFLI